MSRSRISLTPFDTEPHTQVLKDLRRAIEECRSGIEEREKRKRKDSEQIDRLAAEMHRIYACSEDPSADSEGELVGLMRTIFENARRYRKLVREQREVYRIFQSWESGSRRASAEQRVDCETDTCSASLSASARTTTSQENNVAADHGPCQPINAINHGASAGNTDTRTGLYRDLMPEHEQGVEPIPETDKETLSKRLLVQLQTINDVRDREITAAQYRSSFNDRPIFAYKGCDYIARCPIHPDLKMTMEDAKKHYQEKHLVSPQQRLHLQTMRFFGIKIMDTCEELERAADNDRGAPGVEDTTARSDRNHGAADVPVTENEDSASHDTNAMHVDEPPANVPHELRGAEIEVAPSAETMNCDMSTRANLKEAENISAEVVSDRVWWNWTPSWLSPTREATPEQPDNNDHAGTSSNPVVVSDSQDGVSGQHSGLKPQTPRRRMVTLKLRGSPNTVRKKIGVKGVPVSPGLTRPRVPARSSTSTAAAAAAAAATAAAAVTPAAQANVARRHESQGPLLGAHAELMNLDQEEIRRPRNQSPRQAVMEESTSTQQTASPPPSPGVSAGRLGVGSTSAVEEFMGIVNRNFTTYTCPKCGQGFTLRTYLDRHIVSCTGQALRN